MTPAEDMIYRKTQRRTNPYIQSLRRILVAFAYYTWPHPLPKYHGLVNTSKYDIGYCQSLNFIAGFLLLVFTYPKNDTYSSFTPEQRLKTEEDVFWTLVAMIDKLPMEMYGQALEGCTFMQDILWSKLLSPRFGSLLSLYPLTEWMQSLSEEEDDDWERIRVDTNGSISSSVSSTSKLRDMPSLSLISTQWFLTLFLNTLPIVSVLRVWDCFMLYVSILSSFND